MSQQSDKNETVDEELSKLLDSALEDFKTNEQTLPDTKTNDESEVNIKRIMDEFETNLKDFLANGDGIQLPEITTEEIAQRFAAVAEVAKETIENPQINANTSEYAATITRTIQGLSESANSVGTNDDLLMQMLNVNEGGHDLEKSTDMLMPFMQGMMQSFLSKDILYPSLKDILDKFPQWLNDNKSKLTDQDLKNYEKQIELMTKVCNELETEKTDDVEEVKKDRFMKVLNLMQKLQDYGQPPKDLVGEMPPTLQPDPNQCTVM